MKLQMAETDLFDPPATDAPVKPAPLPVYDEAYAAKINRLVDVHDAHAVLGRIPPRQNRRMEAVLVE
jgi:hypothetical protein